MRFGHPIDAKVRAAWLADHRQLFDRCSGYRICELNARDVLVRLR